MLSEYRTRFASLTPHEAGLVTGELHRRRVLPSGSVAEPGRPLNPEKLIGVLDGCHLLAADVVAALASVPGPVALNTIEKILGRPVTILPPQQSPAPPPKHEGAPPPAAPSGIYSRKKIVAISPNPKRPGTGAHERYNLYREEMTVAQYLSEGGHLRDVSWDVKQGFVRMVDV